MRHTQTRQAIAALLAQASTPLTVPEMVERLAKKSGATPHKTTVYREIERLIQEKSVTLVMLPDGIARYELVHEGEHHHHAVCQDCGTIAELSVHEDLSALEKAVAKQSGFSITSHLLEFIGRCRACTRKA